MKNLIFVLLFIISCKGIMCCEYYEEDPLKNIEVQEMHDYYFDNDIKVNSVHEVLIYISNLMTYKKEKKDYWQLPEESYNLKTGDCEDYCILFMYLLKTKLNIDSELVLVMPNKNIIHTVVKYNNQYSDPTMFNGFDNILIPESDIIWTAPYTEVIWMTYNYHDNVGKYIR